MKFDIAGKNDTALYVDMLEVIRQDNASVLYDSESALLIQLKSWPLYLLAATDREEGKRLLLSLQPSEDGDIVLVLRGEELFSAACELGYEYSAPCFQTIYEGKEPLPMKTDLVIRHPGREDYDMIRQTYTLPISEEEVMASIDNPAFAAGYVVSEKMDEKPGGTQDGELDGKPGKLAGFIGLHPEGSIGMLHVYEEFRGRGYARELIAHMINGRLAAGAYPYGQVFIDNEASIALQRKMGMTFSKEYIYWMWKEVK